MVGAGERDEALGMLGRAENMRGVVDADGVVGRRVEHQQRLAQGGEAFVEFLLGHVVEEFTPDAERPPGQRHFHFALLLDLVDVLLEQADDMRGIVGRGDGHHCACVGDPVGGRQHRGAAEAVADQDRRRAIDLAQVVGGGDEIVHVGRKMRVGEFAFAAAEPGEIEAQHGDAVDRQPLGDALGGEVVLAAGEAMREQRVGRRLAERQIERGGELLALGVGKIESRAAHERLQPVDATDRIKASMRSLTEADRARLARRAVAWDFAGLDFANWLKRPTQSCVTFRRCARVPPPRGSPAPADRFC